MEQFFLQFGVSGGTLAALVIIVKSFLKNNKEITESFKNTIDNHIHTQTEHSIELKNAVEQNTKVVEKFLDKLN